MENFIDFFTDLSPLLKLAWIFVCLAFVWLLEAMIPLVQHGYKKVRHVAINLVFLTFTMMINVAVGLATVGVFYWIQTSSFGVLNMIELPI